MVTFRLATVNVFSFQRPSTYENNIADLVSILQPLRLDLIAVEEVQNNSSWEKFCQGLSLPYSCYGAADGDAFGNGIASRYPIQSSSTQVASRSFRGGARSFLQCRLAGDHPFVTDRVFAVTHLDHLSEDDRLEQIKEFKPHKQHVDILLGDMNALTREDYSDKYFQSMVVRKRRESRWEQARFDLTRLLTHEWDYQDAFQLVNPDMKDQQVETCFYRTRIDYIYVHPRVSDRWVLSKCSIIDTRQATDHHAIFAEFKEKH